MQVHWFDDGDDWIVVADGEVTRHADRGAAFAAARRLAQENPPSTVVRGVPDGWARTDGPPPSASAPPVAVERSAPAPAPSSSASAPAHPADDEHWSAPGPPPGPATRDPGVLPPPPRPGAALDEVDWARLAGPPGWGRAVLVAPGAPAPPPWLDVERHMWTADDPAVLELARRAHRSRTPLVWEVPVDAEPPVDIIDRTEVWRLRPSLELVGESTWWLMTANAVDARRPDRPWFEPTERAVAAGARRAGPDDPPRADVVLPDGRPAACDGGPLALPADDSAVAADGVAIVHRVVLERGSLVAGSPAVPSAELAPDQLAAVAEPGACARIVAPAGSGKTRVLTERARHLLADHLLPAGALCLVAFNRRAQQEMAQRTPDLPGLQVQTLNALGLAVLNGGHGFADRGRRVRTVDERDVRSLLDELVSFPRRANTDPAAAWIDALAAVRLGLRDPGEVEAAFGGDVDGLAEVVPRYRQRLAEHGLVDFDEQVYQAIEVLLAEPETRRRAQARCRILLVDELQDLTPAHLLLVRLLAGPELSVFGVGDDDQTIYGFSGASPAWLVGFDRFFPGAAHHDLEVNYRCPAPVVTAALNLLSHNQDRVPKVIRPAADAVANDDALQVEVVDSPVAATLERVERLVRSGTAPADVAVLTRVNSLLAPVQVGLVERGIPTAGTEGARFCERTGVAAALSWLRLATAEGGFASDDLQRAARRPGRSLSPRLVGWVAEQRDLAGLDRLAGRLRDERDADKVRSFAADLERLCGAAVSRSSAELLEIIRTDIGLGRALSGLDAARRGRNTSAHADDLRALVALGELHPAAASFERWLRRVLSTPPDADGVVLATVHKVKGQEWPHVVVHDASAGVLPHHLSTDVEEERRIFHVAITRARRSCVVTAATGEPSLLLGELRQRAAPDQVAGGDRAARGQPAGSPGRPAAARPGPEEVPAVVGMALRWGGYDATISAVGPQAATLSLGRATTEVTYGSTVELDGRRCRLAPPPAGRARSSRPGAPEVRDAEPTVLVALKDWRRDRSRADKVPAYVVASDATLVEIATRLPDDLAALGRVHGIGPAKLERYGDDILGVVDSARPTDGPS